MFSGWWYRTLSIVGTVVLSIGVAIASIGSTSAVLYDQPLDGTTVGYAAVATGFVVGLALEPLYHPRPRRVTAMIGTTIKRIALACVVLTVGGVLFVPSVLTLEVVAVSGASLSVLLPVFYWVIGHRNRAERILVVGDDRELLEAVTDSLPIEPIGVTSPRTRHVPVRRLREMTDGRGRPSSDSMATDGSGVDEPITTDGRGASDSTASEERSDDTSPTREPTVIDGIDRLGGLTRLESLCIDHDVDTLALGFQNADRGEFFGAIETARANGIDVLTHDTHAESVLVEDELEGPLVSVNTDPWPWYTAVTKRAFDLCFTAIGLVVLSPLIVLITIAIKFDSAGPVIYQQSRTTNFGGRFRVFKFRTMAPESEDPVPQEDTDNDRITRVGRVLRKTHLDEIPQLVSVLVGDMSVVGPRAVWVEEERLLEASVDGWRARWHVKPGLTGLAQINDVTSTDGERKLELDLEYVENRSFLVDLRIVLEQMRIVTADAGELAQIRSRDPNFD